MRRLTIVVPIIALTLATPARAEVAHTVAPGETLWSIAAASNLTTRTVAAHNGLSEASQVVLGQTIRVPSPAEGYGSLQRAGLAPAAGAASTGQAAPASQASGAPGASVTQASGAPGASVTQASGAPGAPVTQSPAAPSTSVTQSPAPSSAPTAPAAPASSTAAAPATQGGYTVRVGDTLSGLATGAGVTLSDMAAMNGLDPGATLLAGTVLKLPGGAPAPARATQPAPARQVVPAADPAPTGTRVSAGDIGSVAAAHGVSPSLAAAIAWQESGFNNAMVSSANARGVMQVMPGTWDYVQSNLAGRTLDPASAADNVHAGVLYLKRLLQETGGDEASAIAGYYQGPASVRSRGLYDETQRYVANVQALRGRFGG